MGTQGYWGYWLRGYRVQHRYEKANPLPVPPSTHTHDPWWVTHTPANPYQQVAMSLEKAHEIFDR